MTRNAIILEWRRVEPPTAYHSHGSYHLANPAPNVALNAWRAGHSYWRWGIMAFVNGIALVYRTGEAPTLKEAKLRAESSLPENVIPSLWDYRPIDPEPNPVQDQDEVPF